MGIISLGVKGRSFLYRCFCKNTSDKVITLPKITSDTQAKIVGGLKSDIFVKEKIDKFIPIQEMYPRQMTPLWFQSLSKENYQKYMAILKDYRINTVNPSTIKAFDQYTDILQKSLNTLSPDKPYKFIAIGQTPALFSEILRIKGVETGTIPISSLTYITDLELWNLTPKNLTKYIDYIKNLGVDIEKFSKDKNYFFVDFSDTGRTLNNFKQILKQFGFKRENIHVMSIQDLTKSAPLSKPEMDFTNGIQNYYLNRQIIKDFSPIHKLHYQFLNNIEKIMPTTLDRPTSLRSKIILLSLLNKYYPRST